MTPEKKESQERFEEIHMKNVEEHIENEDVDFLNFRESLLKILAKNIGLTEEELKMLHPRYR